MEVRKRGEGSASSLRPLYLFTLCFNSIRYTAAQHLGTARAPYDGEAAPGSGTCWGILYLAVCDGERVPWPAEPSLMKKIEVHGMV